MSSMYVCMHEGLKGSMHGFRGTWGLRGGTEWIGGGLQGEAQPRAASWGLGDVETAQYVRGCLARTTGGRELRGTRRERGHVRRWHAGA